MRIYLFIFILIPLSLYSQLNDDKRDYNWCFGFAYQPNTHGRTVMTFQNMPPINYLANNNNAVWLGGANTGMSDWFGNLLFYSNYFSILNSNHQIMDNGDSIASGTSYFNSDNTTGCPMPQTVLALPKPSSLYNYYLFNTVYDWGGAGGIMSVRLIVSEIDMSANGGLGKVTQKNIPIINDTIGGGMLTACRHGNGRDWWVLVREYMSNRFHRLLISPAGITDMGTQIIGDNVFDLAGQAIFSPDGSKFVICGVWNQSNIAELYFYDFDRCSGLLSNPKHFQVPQTTSIVPTGIAISPNNRFLYLTSTNDVQQLDFNNIEMVANRITVASNDGFQDSIFGNLSFRAMYLAPDEKIYIGHNGIRYLSVINSPNLLGVSCNVNQHSVKLKTVNLDGSIPNFPHYRLGREIGSACDTIYTSISPPQESVGIQVYPNPAQESLTIELPQKEEAEFVLFDITGRVVLSQKLWKLTETVSLAHLPKGMYFYLLKSEKGILAQGKVVKE